MKLLSSCVCTVKKWFNLNSWQKRFFFSFETQMHDAVNDGKHDVTNCPANDNE